jgi:hypothetical protein
MAGHRLPMRNENRMALDRIVTAVRALSDCYGDIKIAHSELCAAKLLTTLALIRDEDARAALDRLLALASQGDRARTFSSAQKVHFQTEAELLSPLGWPSRRVENCARRALKHSAESADWPHLTSAEDLANCLTDVHTALQSGLTSNGRGVRAWRHRRRLVSAAQDRLLCLSIVIIDGTYRPLFDLSYAVGTSGLNT